MANTNILIKRAGVGGTGRPTSLLAGELAYSYASNTIFIGSPTGNGVVNVGGQFYTSQIDNATTSNTASTLVKRDANGQFSGRFDGIAGKADVITNARNFSISGGDITATAQSFDGSSAVTLSASLNSVPSLGAGTYGSTTAIPVIQVAANGRVMNVTTAAISTSFTVAADAGTPQTVSGGDTLTLVGGQGITSTASATDTVTFDVDTTVVRANAFTGGTQTINTNLTIGSNNSLTVTGNLFVFGNTTSFNIDQFEIEDPLLLLGTGNYFTDTKDIGFAAHYNDGQNAHTGLIRDAGTKEYHFFKGYTGELDANNNINLSDPSYRQANVNADYVKSTGLITSNIASSASQDLQIGPLGKQTTITSATGVFRPFSTIQGGNFDGNIVDVNNIGNGLKLTGNREGVTIATSSDGSGANVSSFNTDGTLTVAGKVTAAGINLNDYTQAAFNKANAAVVNAGSSLTIGSLLIGGGGNNITTLANTTYTLTGSLSAAKTITSLTVDAYGRVTAATGADIAIDASQVTSGTLPIGRGGTNGTSFTDNQITYFDGSKLASLANTTYTQTGTLAANNTITSITVDGFGRFTAATVGAITGLTVAQGGTGLATITTNGITYGRGTSSLGVTAAAGGADQSWSNQILTTTDAGVPVWTTALDGGQF